MKSAQLEYRGTPQKEVVLTMNPDEAKIMYEALQAYCEQNKRLKKAKQLLVDFEDAPIFF